MPDCVQGKWGGCIYAVSALVEEGVMRGALTMRCKLTGKHPDECALARIEAGTAASVFPVAARRARAGNSSKESQSNE